MLLAKKVYHGGAKKGEEKGAQKGAHKERPPAPSSAFQRSPAPIKR